ncbi:hypothetical protein FOCC_FOCC005300 [Frankliniella occidentalis]|nr:hypothetical protein FOCC_FOCC005300 [Frankliniella occidentalis]
MDSASNSAAGEHVSRLECLREHLAKAAEQDEQAVCDNHSSTSMPEWALSSLSLSAAASSPVIASSTCQPTAATAALGAGPSACSTPVPTSVAASSSSPLPARDGGGDAPAATVVLLTGDQAQDLIRSLTSILPASAGAALSGLASGSNGFPASISLHRYLPETLRPQISHVSSTCLDHQQGAFQQLLGSFVWSSLTGFFW